MGAAGDTAGERSGVSRRVLIKRAAAVGGLVWTAPVLIDSLASPAAAGSKGGYPCSYIMVVFQICNHDGTFGNTYAAKYNNGASVCSGNTTSGDETWGPYSCNSHTYTEGSSTQVVQDGVSLPGPPLGSCTGYLTLSGRTVTAASNVRILFALAHDGSYSPSKFKPVCPVLSCGNSVTGPDCGKT